MEPDPRHHADPDQQGFDVSRSYSLSTPEFNLQSLRIVRGTAVAIAKSPDPGAFLHPTSPRH